jgi:hypothetical protein
MAVHILYSDACVPSFPINNHSHLAVFSSDIWVMLVIL